MTSSILNGLSILTKPVGEVSVSQAHGSQQKALLDALQANQALLQEHLQAQGREPEVLEVLAAVRKQAEWASEQTEDITWSFVQECLVLLLGLGRHLAHLRESFDQESLSLLPADSARRRRTPEAAPPLPPDVLSVAQQRTLGTGLQFAVTLGLCPYLAAGVGVPLGRRSALGASVEGAVRRDVLPSTERRLLITAFALLELSTVPSLATELFTSHLGDVMAALCQLGYRLPRPERGAAILGLSAEEHRKCREALQSLLGKVYQPIVIKELLVLQGGPKQSRVGPGGGGAGVGGSRVAALAQAPAWLRRLCGQLLSERLMQPGGVQYVVRAILEGAGGGDSDWRKCDAVARILATCPQQSLSPEAYYSQVCPQVLELLHFKDKLTAQQFQRVATRAALTMVDERLEFAQPYLLEPLFKPLLCCGRITVEGEAKSSVQEWELTRCVDDVYKIFVVGNRPSELLLRSLGDVIPVIFALYSFTKQNASHLRAPCQEILLWHLCQAEGGQALPLLRRLCGLGAEPGGGVAPGWQFSPGSEGGAILTPKEPISDEDEELYERLCGEQWRVECVAQLLGEMKDSDLPANFFLQLLQELTSWTAEQEVEELEQEVDTSSMTLLELELHLIGQVAGPGQKLALLQVLAVLCEGLPHTVLLRKPAQAVEFIVAMLQRACVCLEQGGEGPVEAQTLRMGMGLVAALMSGDTKLSGEDYSAMSKLLPLLEQISELHPDALLKELATDLKAAIATHGAYRPDTITRAAQHHATHTHTGTARTKPTPTARQTQPRRAPAAATATTARAQSKPAKRTEPLITEISSVSMATKDNGTPDAPGAPASSAEQLRVSGSSAERRDRPLAASIPVSPFSAGTAGAEGGPSFISECLLEACDPDVPTRAAALRTLTRALQNHQQEALEAQEKLVTLFLENLEHEDSFIYLSAIQGLAVLAEAFPERILQRLLGEYQTGPSLPSSQPEPSLETRLKMGEVLMRASRAMGELAPHYGHPLIGTFLSGTRDPDPSMRASCLSNMGELCQLLRFSLGPLAQELSVCLTALMKTEKEAEVRRAAVHVITLLLRGLSHTATQVLSDVLLDLYRALKWVVRSDRDEVAVLHAQLALEELDDIMRKFIFPEQKLEKKIVVLP
ncbi:transport and Golgi organization protein 6 homolog isoform X2 [Clupea harengus]|uniref:Transport and Golgi organization protein 6 homolog isoform X2 n=1 Tax=Clupea harengus TaxID=7950 RepID=A0A6P8FAJ1_CLUHA|nr:transport and Golgi organization protein 6 homolog isoform X2 [Clupea harengus]